MRRVENNKDGGREPLPNRRIAYYLFVQQDQLSFWSLQISHFSSWKRAPRKFEVSLSVRIAVDFYHHPIETIESLRDAVVENRGAKPPTASPLKGERLLKCDLRVKCPHSRGSITEDRLDPYDPQILSVRAGGG